MTLLEKTRSLNRLLQRSAGHPVDFDEICRVLSELSRANVYVVSRRGKILGHALKEGYSCAVMETDVLKNKKFPDSFNDRTLRILDTTTFKQDEGKCVFDSEMGCLFPRQELCFVPINGSGERLGSLIVAKFDQTFNEEDLILAEYGATVVGMEILRAKSDEIEEEARKKAAVQIALGTLSYSELEAVVHIFEELDGTEGLLVASKVADRVGITRSVIVNALRKFESAGVIESRSLGMKGTYIKVLNDRLLDELKKIK
ncbi:MAG TPA: GTP-sensing pleiotropic transcriptional regulator CodY [Firmicutes bacterium]|jgi:transcriptional pleiotropic repressor|nr:GTP-sensing pleiotropic transcriptional regulator CodY [Bacillota bacterium]